MRAPEGLQRANQCCTPYLKHCPDVRLPSKRSNMQTFKIVSYLRFREALSLVLISIAVNAYTQSASSSQHYKQTNLISDQTGVAAVTDPNLVNPWGLARSSTS